MFGRYVLIFTVAISLSSVANAATVFCNFNHWSGGKTEEVTVSWVGTGAELNHSKSTLRRTWSGGRKGEWHQYEAKKTQDFTTYIDYRTTESDKGDEFRMRFSYRFFKNGRCEAHITLTGFSPMLASGRWDR